MKNFAALFFPALMLCGLLRIIALPIRWFWKLTINSVCGFLCLWILNAVGPYTGIFFPINAVTTLTAGTLGLPGIAILAVLAVIL